MTVRLVSLLLPLCTLTFAQDKSPVRWTMTVEPVQVRGGMALHARLAAAIDQGWHLYSMKELDGGPIPTRIAVPEGQPFRQAGSVEASRPVERQDETFGMAVESYEDSAEFVVPVEAAKSVPAGDAELQVSVRYQLCDDKICLPPRTVRLTAKVTVRK